MKFFNTEQNAKFLAFYERAATLYPEMFVGFDFVSYEGMAPLVNFSNHVRDHFKDKEFEPKVLYHAGESYSRSSTNCKEAILSGSPRIGHALNLLRDPESIQQAKEKNILIEACPLSNWVLGYTGDLHWHPVKFLKEFGLKIR